MSRGIVVICPGERFGYNFAHDEFSKPIYSDVEVIRKNILEKKDLFKRGWNYQKIDLDETFPSHIYKNKKLFKEWIV